MIGASLLAGSLLVVKQSFEQYVREGGGVVAVHAADNAFPNWTAFNEMIGVGGWRGRTEQQGPYWYYKDGPRTPLPERPAAMGSGHPFRSRFGEAIRSPTVSRISGCTRATNCTRVCAAPGRHCSRDSLFGSVE
jgi:hypothetical protein